MLSAVHRLEAGVSIFASRLVAMGLGSGGIDDPQEVSRSICVLATKVPLFLILAAFDLGTHPLLRVIADALVELRPEGVGEADLDDMDFAVELRQLACDLAGVQRDWVDVTAEAKGLRKRTGRGR
jgi:hypothetical protein